MEAEKPIAARNMSRLVFACVPLWLGLAACGGGPGLMGFDPGPPVGEPLSTLRSADGTWDVSLWTAPQPPPKGSVEVKYRIVDQTQTPIDGLALQVVPWMPAHGHGTSVAAIVTPEGEGYYLVKPVFLYMSGRWELRTTIGGIAGDGVVPVVDVP